MGLQDGYQCPHVLYIERVEGRVPVPLRGARHGNGTDGATGDDSAVHAVCRGRWSDDTVQQLARLRDVTLGRREKGREGRREKGREGRRETGIGRREGEGRREEVKVHTLNRMSV